jgi:hypothetical protein
VGANREKGVSVCVDYRTDCFTDGLTEKIWVIEGAGAGSPGGAHHGGATHSSGLTDLMLGTHICMGITYKSKYYRINHIAPSFEPYICKFSTLTSILSMYHPLRRCRPPPPSTATPFLPRCRRPSPQATPLLPRFRRPSPQATPLLPRFRQLASPPWLGPHIDKIPLEHLEPHANKETFDTLE